MTSFAALSVPHVVTGVGQRVRRFVLTLLPRAPDDTAAPGRTLPPAIADLVASSGGVMSDHLEREIMSRWR
jgi:hypothetical protein